MIVWIDQVYLKEILTDLEKIEFSVRPELLSRRERHDSGYFIDSYASKRTMDFCMFKI